MNKKPLKIIANPYLFYGGIIFCIFCFLLCLYMAFIVITPDIVNPPEDTKLIRGWFVFMGVAMIGAGFLCMPRWLEIIAFEENVIKFKSAFHKEIIKPYSNYHFAYLAYYSHLGLPVKFIVLSQRKLNQSELENINKVKSNGQIIKIKYSKKTLSKLQQVLTEKQKNQLDKQLSI